MTNYENLVEALRSASTVSTAWEKLMIDAAAAIEALIADVEKKESRITGLGNRIFALEQQLPKRGEIVRCKECIHFAQGGWCDREFDWFPVDENDFCSMAEKMEVQYDKA